ncbi:MAG: PEFG-CTERM sorting domain-containing protein [Nitrososphaerales archaeon]
MQKVKAAGNDIDLDVQSSSSITDFTFSETDKKISFKVSGPDGTDGTTVIPVSKVLQGPYTVTFDGNAMTDFQTMTSPTGDVSIKLAYKQGTHGVTITGTSVVPEFPAISALILTVSFLAIIGFTVAAKRSKVWALVP